MTRTKYSGMFRDNSRFTPATRVRLERAVGRALFGEKSTRKPLRSAVQQAAGELRVQGLDLAHMQTYFGALVEDAGRSCGADRPSLMSREPMWTAVRDEVLDAAAHAHAESER